MKTLLGLSLITLLVACGGPADSSTNGSTNGSTTSSGTSSQAEPRQVEERPEDRETVFDPMVSTIDRAKGVEDANMKRKAEMDAALEDM
jgi:hypothetical protein